jgi:hypothetical protein
MNDIIFRIFMVPDEAEAYAAELNAHGIATEIRTEAGPLPDFILGGTAVQRYLLLIQEEDQADAEMHIARWMTQQIGKEQPKAHFFDGYSKEELMKVISEGLEWSDYDIAYAKWLLSRYSMLD